MLVWLYGEMRDALWPEHGLSGSMASFAPDVASLPVCHVLRGRARSKGRAFAGLKCFGQ